MESLAIVMEKVDKIFAKNRVLQQMDFAVPTGSVYALLGRNGVGKTTALRILLGLLAPTQGSSQVFGLDSQRDDWRIRQQVGYVAEGQKIYGWMTIAETVWFISKFYPTWDTAYAGSLLKKFELSANSKIEHLSRGMYSKLCLALALAHRPKLLVLDEATSGLDVLIRREFLDSIIELVGQQGCTVLIASHLLNDVERVSDYVGFLQDGRLKISGRLEDLKKSLRKIKLTFADVLQSSLELPDKIHEELCGREAVVTVQNFSQATEAALQRLGAKEVRFLDMSLEDMFAEYLAQPNKEDQA
jgi:ABC-2 type transport system ATP-binding protein